MSKNRNKESLNDNERFEATETIIPIDETAFDELDKLIVPSNNVSGAMVLSDDNIKGFSVIKNWMINRNVKDRVVSSKEIFKMCSLDFIDFKDKVDREKHPNGSYYYFRALTVGLSNVDSLKNLIAKPVKNSNGDKIRFILED